MNKVILATTNNSKIEPFKYAWQQNSLKDVLELLTFADLGKPGFDVEEDTGSFELDALKKAKSYAAHFDLPTISLDRGIEIPSLGNWPGTDSKYVFTGTDAETKQFIKVDRSEKENEIEIAKYVIDKITDPKRIVMSVYGIAVSLPNQEAVSATVKYPGKAADTVVIGEVGWNYDWFYMPDGLGKTLSSLTESEYIEFTATHMWTIPQSIEAYLLNLANR